MNLRDKFKSIDDLIRNHCGDIICLIKTLRLLLMGRLRSGSPAFGNFGSIIQINPCNDLFKSANNGHSSLVNQVSFVLGQTLASLVYSASS